ncbi:hypothetical protein CMU14_15835 [Elizabethkingia anophelis]|nr:hypothetical protein [Elizabethkingia anophelis]
MKNRITIVGILIILVSVRCSQDRDTDNFISKTSMKEATKIKFKERNFKIKDNLKRDAAKRDSIQYRQFNGETKADAAETVDPEKVKPPRI